MNRDVFRVPATAHGAEASALPRPARPVVVQDCPLRADSKDVSSAAPLYAVEADGRQARLRTPARPIVVQDRPRRADGEEVLLRRREIVRRAARLRTPRHGVRRMENRAAIADQEEVARRAGATAKGVRGAAREWAPGGAIEA